MTDNEETIIISNSHPRKSKKEKKKSCTPKEIFFVWKKNVAPWKTNQFLVLFDLNCVVLVHTLAHMIYTTYTHTNKNKTNKETYTHKKHPYTQRENTHENLFFFMLVQLKFNWWFSLSMLCSMDLIIIENLDYTK